MPAGRFSETALAIDLLLIGVVGKLIIVVHAAAKGQRAAQGSVSGCVGRP
jgi:hypothetical protein